MNKIFTGILIFFFSQSYSQLQLDAFEIAKTGTLQNAKDLITQNHKSFKIIDNRGFSPLIIATYSGNDEVANFIMSYSDLDLVSPMGTALMAAVVKGNRELTFSLLSKKANPNLTDTNGTTALMYAVQFRNKELIEILLLHHSDKNLIDKNGRTAFEMATTSGDDLIINLLK